MSAPVEQGHLGLAPSQLRWPAAAALLAAEYLLLTLLIEFPTSGPATQLVPVVRMLSPAVVGAGVASILIARHGSAAAQPPLSRGGEHRPWGALALHLLAFALTAAYGFRLMRPGAPPVALGALAAWAAAAALTVTLAAGIAAPLGALWRMAVQHVRVPLLAFGIGLLSWRAVASAEALWGWLRGGTLAAVAALLGPVSGDVTLIPAESVIGMGGFEVEIAPMCSGADGLGLVLVFQAVWLSLARSRVRFGRALLVLLPLGASLVLAANVLRIAALVLLGASGREELALGAFHSKLGWLLFTGVALGSVAIAENLPWLRRAPAAERAADVGLPPATTAYVAPLFAALATALVTSLWSRGGFDPWYGARLVAGVLVLLLVRRRLPSPALSFSWVPIALAAGVCAFWIPWAGGGGSALESALAALGPGERGAWIAIRLLGACLVLPVLEELAFRGFLLPWLIAPDLGALPPRTWTWPAVLVSSLAFGAIHEQWLLGTAAGIAFAAARVWRGRLGDAIVAHVACNVGVSIAVLAGRWGLWA